MVACVIFLIAAHASAFISHFSQTIPRQRVEQNMMMMKEEWKSLILCAEHTFSQEPPTAAAPLDFRVLCKARSTYCDQDPRWSTWRQSTLFAGTPSYTLYTNVHQARIQFPVWLCEGIVSSPCTSAAARYENVQLPPLHTVVGIRGNSLRHTNAAAAL